MINIKSAFLLVVIVFLLLELINRHRPAKVHYRKKMMGNYNARTLPPFGIYIQEAHKDNQALLNHELVHWQQYQRLGLLGYYLAYLVESTNGYDCNGMEIEARANESEYCQMNYTECVRNGQAKTIHNPKFRM